MVILISNMNMDIVIGILPTEAKTQRVLFNAKVEYHYKGGVFLDYSALVDDIRLFFSKSKYGIIEEALVDLSSHLLKLYPDIVQMKLKLEKPEAMKDCVVGVEFESKR